jgi:cation:H+ antiporter
LRANDDEGSRGAIIVFILGVILLSTATSLPEVATAITAVALLNNPPLAVYNLLGGVALQTAILAIADRTKRQSGALTFFEPRFVLLLQGFGLPRRRPS